MTSSLFPRAGSTLWPVLFWRDNRPELEAHRKLNPIGAWIFSALGAVLGGGSDATYEPRQCVRADVPRADRERLGKALAGGIEHEIFMGHALCRICGIELGCRDLHGYGFLWPERAEHYVLEHDVWSPGCARLFTAIGTT